MEDFFTKAFESHPDRESFYRTVFMAESSDYAAGVRREYYKSKLKHMGETSISART